MIKNCGFMVTNLYIGYKDLIPLNKIARVFS